MGTNYYAYRDVCPHCGRCDEEDVLHIGKSSCGWCFSLHVIPEEHLNTLDDWMELLSMPYVIIKNEYGDEVTVEKLYNIITERGREKPPTFETGRYRSAEAFMAENNAVQGPNNLWRHKIGRFCCGHGEGTWDYMPGYFS